MSGLRDQFQRFYTPDDAVTADAMRDGLITPDTNVLLSLYRFQPQARDELFRVLETFGDRLWIPYQVGLEFHRNRLKVIAEQEKFFGTTKEDLEKSLNDYIAKFKTFAKRISLAHSNIAEIEKGMRQAHADVQAAVMNAENANEVHLDSRDSDEILARLEVLFDGHVGTPMNAADLESARKEAQRRIKEEIPPGYMDKSKADPTGDFIIWKQLMQEAAKRRLPTILVTDDHKPDWFRREHGLTLGPRPELHKEMETEAGVSLFIMTSETFLIKAKKHLGISVSPTTVNQAKELPESIAESSRRRRHSEYATLMRHREELLQALNDLEQKHGYLSTRQSHLEAMGSWNNPSNEDLNKLMTEREELRAQAAITQINVEQARALLDQVDR